MNDANSSSGVSAMHYYMFRSGISILIIVTIIMFVLFIYRKNARMPKGLFISSLVSYVVLVGYLSGLILGLCSNFWICQIIRCLKLLCSMVTLPSLYITIGFIKFINLMREMFGLFPPYLMYTHLILIYLCMFVINALLIFGIIRLILFIKHKITSRRLKEA
jgi:hypothetical protein